MDYEVVWTDEAQASFHNIIEYLTVNFTDKEVKRFVTAAFQKIAFIENNPYTYRRSGKYKKLSLHKYPSQNNSCLSH